MIGHMGARLDFFADVVQSGTIMGLDANLGPDAATAILGPDFGENRSRRILWRAYGLVELSWYLRERGLGLSGEHWAVQARRLEHGEEVVNDAIAARYGRFGGLQNFDELRDELKRRNVELVQLNDAYWQPDAQVKLYLWEGSVQKIFSAYGEDFRDTFDADYRVVWQ